MEFFNAHGKNGIKEFNKIGITNLMLDLKLKDIPETVYKAIKALNRLKDFKTSRDNNSVKEKLNSLHTIAQGQQNLISPIIECIKSKCTIGEISDQLRDTFGEYQSSI